MKHCNGVKQGLRAAFNLPPLKSASSPLASRIHRRALHYDGRKRLSNFWTPTQASKKDAEACNTEDDGHDRLARAGFLRQAHSGIFHLLPLGLRVQDKIERLVDKHMQRLGASKVSLSSFSSEELWQRSGRLDKGRASEFFRIEDRKGAKYLLSPTHEEEVTTIIANAVHSYKDLPLRLYQVSRKYRDELRPRQGLLRGREFLMKDLYTFDVTEDKARETYEEVRQAYAAFLDELRIPYLVASADSGNMGGNLSHEYHFASTMGEDTIITCQKCGHAINEELFTPQPEVVQQDSTSTQDNDLYLAPCRGCNALYPPTITRAVEIGHTFHLSTRYTIPLNANVLTASNNSVPIQMGCHGIGLSRLLAATSSILADSKGLNWPLVIAPFAAVIVPTASTTVEDLTVFYDDVFGNNLQRTAMDAIIDDRPNSVGWKLKDADSIGYPFVLVLGKAWEREKKVEVQCRRLKVKDEVAVEDIPARLREYATSL